MSTADGLLWVVASQYNYDLVVLYPELEDEWMAVKYGDTEDTVGTLSYGCMIPLTPDPLKSLVSQRLWPRHLPAVPEGEASYSKTDSHLE